MKTRQNILLVAIYLASFSILMSCANNNGKVISSQRVSHLQIPTIEFVPAGPNLNIPAGGSERCNTNTNAKGCIEVDQGDSAMVTFILQGNPNYHFTEIKICKGDKYDKDNGLLVCTLSLKEQTDFEFTDPSGSPTDKKYPSALGVLNLEEFSGDLRSFELLDDNRVKMDYFYQVEACEPLNLKTTCIKSDPPIRNKGK